MIGQVLRITYYVLLRSENSIMYQNITHFLRSWVRTPVVCVRHCAVADEYVATVCMAFARSVAAAEIFCSWTATPTNRCRHS